MQKSDFKIMTCNKCHKRHYYYAPFTKDKGEIEEYKNCFEVEIDENFHFSGKCNCGGNLTEAETLTSNDCIELLGNLLEDDNRHSITGIGRVISNCCDAAGADENIKTNILKSLLDYYDNYHSLN